jgi:hypothetical protein
MNVLGREPTYVASPAIRLCFDYRKHATVLEVAISAPKRGPDSERPHRFANHAQRPPHDAGITCEEPQKAALGTRTPQDAGASTALKRELAAREKRLWRLSLLTPSRFLS